MNLAARIKSNIKDFVFFILDKYAVFFVKEKPLPENRNEIQKILVFEGGGIGDLLRIFPAIEAIHDNFPHASISLLSSPHSQGILYLFPKREFLSEIIDYDIRGKHKSFLKKLALISSLRKLHFDLTYSPSRGEGMREHLIISFLTGARHRMGFKIGHRGLLSTIRVEFKKEDIPIVKQNVAILKAARLKIDNCNIRLEVPEKEMNSASNILKRLEFINSYPLITVHTGALWNAKYRCWPFEKYIALVKRLLNELHAKVIIIGSEIETEAGERIVREIQDKSIVSLSGKTDIPLMAAIIRLSHLFIGNDSGPLHIASALNIPFIGIFASTLPEQVLSNAQNGIILHKKLTCGPCYMHDPLFTPPCEGIHEVPPCLDMITVEEVMNAVTKLLLKYQCIDNLR
jgi:ADP-heptose:LPS heptosyltransferase